jgi:spermidine synthase
MTPWTLVEAHEDDDGMLHELYRRGEHYSIWVGGHLLMNSRVHGSERALAELTLDALGERPRARVLVGGLGFGYTLAAALARLEASASALVAEVSSAVIRWNRELLGTLNGGALDDERVGVFEGDICELVRSRTETFDAILLDVDNGPRAVARTSNGYLYSPEGLAALRASLRPNGVLAVWSAGPEVSFSERLRASGFDVVLHRVQSHAARTRERHFVWVATVPGSAAQ